jgi:hypothetical protein
MLCTECMSGELIDCGDYLECDNCEAQFEMTDDEDDLEVIDPEEEH